MMLSLSLSLFIIISLTYLYFLPLYLLDGVSQGGYPEPILKVYIIFSFVTCDMFDSMIMYSAAPSRVWFTLNIYPTLYWVH